MIQKNTCDKAGAQVKMENKEKERSGGGVFKSMDLKIFRRAAGEQAPRRLLAQMRTLALQGNAVFLCGSLFGTKKQTSDWTSAFLCLKRVKRCLSRGKNEQKVSNNTNMNYFFLFFFYLFDNDNTE